MKLFGNSDVSSRSVERLNYHHLLYFWMVAREGTVAGAARQLRLAQPTLSGQIRTLENALALESGCLEHLAGARIPGLVSFIGLVALAA